MKTLITGEKLPSHSELYLFWEKGIWSTQILQQLVPKHASKREIRRLMENYHLQKSDKYDSILSNFFSQWNWIVGEWGYTLEKNNWDIEIYSKSKDNFPTFRFFIEYKTSIDEWKKGIDDFLRQLNNRSVYGCDSDTKVKFLMSFDQRFETYRTLLSAQKIELIILPQALLEKALTPEMPHIEVLTK